MSEDYNLDEIKGFVKTHCDPQASFEMKAKEAAWALLQELNNRKDCDCSCSKEKESDEEAGAVAAKDEKSIEDTNSEVAEKLGGEQKFKKLQNTKQGNSSYFEFAKQQMQAIGAAGVIAMSAGVATQAETIKTESAVIVTHVRHEVPAIDKFLVNMEEAVKLMMSKIPFLPNNNASMGGSTSSTGSSGSAQATAAATATGGTEATKSEESAAETAEATTEESKTEETAKTEESKAAETVAAETTSEESPASESTKEETASVEEAIKSAEAPEMEIPKPVIVPHTTEVNPPMNNNERNNSKTNRSNTR
jgi:hypothetical protein